MSIGKAIVTATLATILPGIAAADDDSSTEPKSRKVQQALVVLGNLGLDNPEIVQFVSTVEKRVDNGYLRLGEERVMDGTVTLHYELSGGVRAKQVELKYAPDDSNFEYTARPNAVMASYKFTW